jgi:hypothetical protein
MVATDEDQRRIVKSRNGDHGAFEALIREHQRMIHSLCYRMSGSLADAEDLAQETFIHAYRRLAIGRILPLDDGRIRVEPAAFRLNPPAT